VDDLIPAEIAAGYLEDDVLQETGAQEPGRAATLAGADPDGHAPLLVQVGHPHLEAFPHVRRQGAEGHAADDQGVDLPHRGCPALFTRGLDQFLRREDPAQEGPQFEVVASRVQGRIGEHGDADELDLVQDAPGIVAPAAPAAGRPALIDVEAELVHLGGPDGPDGPVGTDQVAHAAADAGMGRVGPLVDAVIDGKDVARLLREADSRLDEPFPVDSQFDGPDGADGGAAPAEGAGLPIPDDPPGEVAAAQGGGGHLSH